MSTYTGTLSEEFLNVLFTYEYEITHYYETRDHPSELSTDIRLINIEGRADDIHNLIFELVFTNKFNPTLKPDFKYNFIQIIGRDLENVYFDGYTNSIYRLLEHAALTHENF